MHILTLPSLFRSRGENSFPGGQTEIYTAMTPGTSRPLQKAAAAKQSNGSHTRGLLQTAAKDLV